MNKQNSVRVTVIFVALFATGVLMIVAAFSFADAGLQPVFYSIGSVISSAALTFFLIEIFRINRESQGRERDTH